MDVLETQVMIEAVPTYRFGVFYWLLLIDVIVIIIPFTTVLLTPLGLANFFAVLLFGSISLVAGVWATAQYIRGKHDRRILLGLSLVLIGLIMLTAFFGILNILM